MNNIKEYIYPKSLKMNYFNNKLNIVNYDEIVILTENKIILIKDNKNIIISGSKLTLLKLLDREILIGGIIKTIEI